MHADVSPEVNIPTIIVILGGTGDLSRRKLLPALFDLYTREFLPDRFKIVGLARSEHTNDDYRAFVKNAITQKGHGHSTEAIDSFLQNVTYCTGTFEDPESYRGLADHLIDIEGEFGQCSNKLFYLAVPPMRYETILRNLADSGLTIPCSRETGWTRVFVEKPFGSNIAAAQELDRILGLLFKEAQIFRIDHYLGKEALQDILMFRFSNLIFEPLWSNAYIKSVHIALYEESGVRGRGAFYDGIGALRDVGQNHLLQMLAAIAMENPGSLDAEAIRTERARVLKALPHMTARHAARDTTRGQYEGYHNEEGVAAESETETYFKIKTEVKNRRWKGVPFCLESGKALGESKAEITIAFKKTDACLCPPDAEQHHANTLTFRIQPDEGIMIRFWAKKSGFTSELEPKELAFAYNGKAQDKRIPDAYERVLYDGIIGDQILFPSTKEVLLAWEFVTPILEHWSTTPLKRYKKGSNGPEEENIIAT